MISSPLPRVMVRIMCPCKLLPIWYNYFQYSFIPRHAVYQRRATWNNLLVAPMEHMKRRQNPLPKKQCSCYHQCRVSRNVACVRFPSGPIYDSSSKPAGGEVLVVPGIPNRTCNRYREPRGVAKRKTKPSPSRPLNPKGRRRYRPRRRVPAHAVSFIMS